MSTSLYVRPHRPSILGKGLSYELKKAISQKYWSHDGSLGGEWVMLSSDDLAYFEGLRDAGIEDADTIIDEITKHGVVEIALVN